MSKEIKTATTVNALPRAGHMKEKKEVIYYVSSTYRRSHHRLRPFLHPLMKIREGMTEEMMVIKTKQPTD